MSLSQRKSSEYLVVDWRISAQLVLHQLLVAAYCVSADVKLLGQGYNDRKFVEIPFI